MESARLRYDDRPDEGGGAEEGSSSQVAEQEEEVPCVLDIYVHHARGIHKHNTCIHAANQDVYARFALTSAPDDDAASLITTRVVAAAGGGASPRFDERLPPLRLRVRPGRVAIDVLKCEVWMRSSCACARRRMLDDDQLLLGFTLVPLAAIAAATGARLDDRDFELSSTDLFHSPAGTIRLSLALRSGVPGDACPPPEPSSIALEVVIFQPPSPPPVDYSRTIEFDDLNVVEQENQAIMAVQYLPFLHLGGTRRRPPEVAMEDAKMSTSPRGEIKAASSDASRNASTSTTSTVSDDDRVVSASAGAIEKPAAAEVDEATTVPTTCRSPETPTSCGGEKADDVLFKQSPLGGIDVEAEQSAMQRQIMEMYVKSMQQFSESLPKVQLPLELDGVVIQKEEKPDDKVIHIRQQQQVKKDGARVFYGSRAFF